MTEHHGSSPAPGEKQGWADQPWFRKLFLGALVAACIGAAALGFIPEFQKEHPHFTSENSPFPTEEFPVFFALYGFIMFSLIVLIGQHLRKLVARKESYYDERE